MGADWRRHTLGYTHVTATDRQAIWDGWGEGMNPAEIAAATDGAYHTVASLIEVAAVLTIGLPLWWARRNR